MGILTGCLNSLACVEALELDAYLVACYDVGWSQFCLCHVSGTDVAVPGPTGLLLLLVARSKRRARDWAVNLRQISRLILRCLKDHPRGICSWRKALARPKQRQVVPKIDECGHRKPRTPSEDGTSNTFNMLSLTSCHALRSDEPNFGRCPCDAWKPVACSVMVFSTI